MRLLRYARNDIRENFLRFHQSWDRKILVSGLDIWNNLIQWVVKFHGTPYTSTMKIFFLLLFWSLWYVNFSTRTIISPILPIIEDEFAISHAVAGSIFSFLSLGYTITLLLSGVLSPRIGYKRSIALGFLVLMTSLFFLRYSTTYASFAATSL